MAGGFAEPMFVVAIEPATRAVVIGTRDELLGRGIVAREVNWLGAAPEIGAEVCVQIRHRSRPAAGVLVRRDGDEVELALDEPVSAISPGQSMVLYDQSDWNSARSTFFGSPTTTKRAFLKYRVATRWMSAGVTARTLSTSTSAFLQPPPVNSNAPSCAACPRFVSCPIQYALT